MSRDRTIDKYLHGYAQDDAEVSRIVGQRYDQVLVVPARDERAEFVDSLGVEHVDLKTLIVIVVNGRVDDDAELHRRNARLISDLKARGMVKAECEGGTWLWRHGGDVLLVDRASDGRRLGARQGVGQARRVGFDTALRLIASGAIASDWMHTTDADATLPPRHFAVPNDSVARVSNFWHVSGQGPVGRATALYEVWLRYYVIALAWAESPWAYHSIGSCISVRAHEYAQVRGVPDRQAGEDFHLLAKLAKVGAIARGGTEPVLLRCRTSARVPFGTGPAVARLLKGHALMLYDPCSFACLRQVNGQLAAWDRIVSMGTDPSAALTGGDPLITAALGHIGWPQAYRRLATQKTPSARSLIEWFDAVRTLRFVHALRDLAMPALPWRVALQRAPFGPFDDGDVDQLREQMRAMEHAAIHARARTWVR